VAARSQVNPGTEYRPADEECRALVARILAGPEFQRTTRLRAFLTYVVERTLAGRTEDVSEVLIGHRVFGRSASYNPGEDSIVRTEARSLRQRLERYFSGEGAAEPVILEIPRGGYLPVFRPRPETPGSSGPPPVVLDAGTSAGLSRRQWIGLGAAGTALAAAAGWVRAGSAGRERAAARGRAAEGAVHLESSDPRLRLAFHHAKERAMAGVYTGDPVGDWYAGSRDNRAFCMRDIAHESAGAAVLGLHRQTLNMLRRFADSIAKSRQWCGYWIITKDALPDNYANDEDFGYCLPANFDLLGACCHQLLWSGDRQYLDPVFTTFYDRTVTQFVQAWDHDRDGVMENWRDRPRIAATYYQHAPHLLTGADLVAAQYGGYEAYAAIQQFKGGHGSLSELIAAEYRSKAGALRQRFDAEWWNASQNRFWTGIQRDHRWHGDYVATCNVFMLKFGMPEDGPKADAALDLMEHDRPPYDSTYTYYPEVLYRYGRNESAYRFLFEISDPAFSGYGLAEAAFAVIGATATGLMGVAANAAERRIETLPRLPKSLEWVRMEKIPVLSNQIAVEHRGVAETRFTNQAGPALSWKAAFPSAGAGILIDGASAHVTAEERPDGGRAFYVEVPVKAGQTRTARVA